MLRQFVSFFDNYDNIEIYIISFVYFFTLKFILLYLQYFLLYNTIFNISLYIFAISLFLKIFEEKIKNFIYFKYINLYIFIYIYIYLSNLNIELINLCYYSIFKFNWVFNYIISIATIIFLYEKILFNF